MNIAFIVPSLINKGPIIVIESLINELIKMGLNRNDFVVYYFDNHKGANFTCETKQISFNKPIDFDQFDIIHSNMYRPDKYVAKWRKKIHKAKIITTIHCVIDKDLKFTYGFLISFIFSKIWLNCLRKFDYTVGISEYIYNLYNSKIHNCIQINNGVNIEIDNTNYKNEIRERIKKEKVKGKKILFDYCNIDKRKGLDQVLEVLTKRNDYSFIIIGNGNYENELRKKIVDLKLTDCVFLFPYQKQPYVYIKDIDIFIMPSLSEGFGLALVEAASLGASCVCSDLEVFYELFTAEEVTYFEINNIDLLSKAIDIAYENKDKKIELAQTKALRNYSALHMAKEYLMLYKRITNMEGV